jgi:uncharacterized protein (TIGR03067 family)
LCVASDAAANDSNAAVAAPSDPNAADLARMQGDWMVSSMIADGMKLPDEEAQSLFRTVEGDKYNVSRYAKRVGYGTFVIDATKSPATIDSTPATADPKKKILGIYQWDGERLQVCNAQLGFPRPKTFEAKLGTGHTMIIWEREKK